MAEPRLPPPASTGPVDPLILADALRVDLPGSFPWRALALFFVPAAGLAGGAALQFLIEGPVPAGDAVLRWLFWSAGAGSLAGAVAGLALSRRALPRLAWAALGAGAPFLLTALVSGTVQRVRPLRDQLARYGEAKCRTTRTLCSASEFRSACAEAAQPGPAAQPVVVAARAKLGAPAQSLCDGAGCTHRWTYPGPWTPDNYVPPGSLLCSVVTDSAGAAVRYALGPGRDPRD